MPFPTPLSIKFFDEHPSITLSGALDLGAADKFRASALELYKLGNRAWTVFINSPGGQLMEITAIYDLIRFFCAGGVNIAMVVNGRCQSGAPLLLMAVPLNQRACTAHARFMLHCTSITINDKKVRCRPQKPTDLIKAHEQLSSSDGPAAMIMIEEAYDAQATLIRLLTEGSNLTADQLHKMLEKEEVWFGAEEALEYGLIGQIL